MIEPGTNLRACAGEPSRTKIPFFALAPRRGSLKREELGGAHAGDASEDLKWPQPAELARSNERKRSASRS